MRGPISKLIYPPSLVMALVNLFLLVLHSLSCVTSSTFININFPFITCPYHSSSGLYRNMISFPLFYVVSSHYFLNLHCIPSIFLHTHIFFGILKHISPLSYTVCVLQSLCSQSSSCFNQHFALLQHFPDICAFQLVLFSLPLPDW